jgi:hypothetical protein
MSEESNTEQIINEYVDAAIEQLEVVEQELRPLRKKKRQTILDLAYKISETGAVPYDYVADYLCRHQKKILDYVSEEWIRGVLPSSITKPKKKVSSVIGMNSKNTYNENKKVIEVTTTGQEASSQYANEPVDSIPDRETNNNNTQAPTQDKQEERQDNRDIIILHVRPEPALRARMNRIWSSESYADIDFDVNTQTIVDVKDGGKK